MGLSDVISEVEEAMWAGIQDYPYSEAHKGELTSALESLTFVRLMLDRPGSHSVEARAKLVQEAHMLVCKRWASRCCGRDYYDVEDEDD
jgi:hypothetical protein